MRFVDVELKFRSISAEVKLQIYVKIVRLLLEDDDHVNAEAYLNRAALLIHDSKDAIMNLSFRV